MKKTKRGIGASFVALGALMLSVLAPVAAFADSDVVEETTPSDTCKNDFGYDEDFTTTQSGDWGSATFTTGGPGLDLVVNAGFEVDVCIKTGGGVTEHLDKDEGTYLDLRGPLNNGGQTSNISHVGLDIRPVENDDDVDLCDPANKPATGDIASWHANEGFDGSTCVDVKVVQECGYLNAEVTGDRTGYGYDFRWVEGDEKPANPDNDDFDNAMPATFDPNEGDGSVEVTYYIVGPEDDYFRLATGSDDVANWWNNPVTVTVDTDCDSGEETQDVTVIKDWLDEDDNFVDGPSASDVDDLVITVFLSNETDIELRPIDFKTVKGEGNSYWEHVAEIDADLDVVRVTETSVPNGYADVTSEFCNMSQGEASIQAGEGQLLTDEIIRPFDNLFVVCNQEVPGGGDTGGSTPITPEVLPAAVEPAASITSECVADETLEVNYLLDNTLSEDGVTFGVDVSGQGASNIDVGAEASTPGGFVVTPDEANVIVIIGAEGRKFVDTTLNAEDCITPEEEIDVLDDAEEADDDPEPQPVARGLDQAAEVVSERASLPDTGASALVLTLMGLLSMGFGGALLRPRKRD